MTKSAEWPSPIEYTITDFAVQYTAPQFVIVPDYCKFRVVCTYSSTVGDSLFTDLNVGGNPPTFSIERTNSLEDLTTGQSVTCTAESYTDYVPINPNTGLPEPVVPKKSAPGSVQVNLKNPCIDQNFVSINQLSPPLENVDYSLGQGALQITPHSDFTLTTKPRQAQHDLCGPIAVKPEFEGEPLKAGDPVTYNPNAKQFTCQTSDPKFERSVLTYGLVACLADWPPETNPGVTTRNPTGRIAIDSPCSDPTGFAATVQDNISDAYSGNTLEWTLNPFSISPSSCEIVYECISVQRVGTSNTNEITCEDLNFDGRFD